MNPWGLFFSAIVDFRKSLYHKRILKSYKLPVNILSVGNITFGGTGKSPLVSFLLSKFSSSKKIAVLSRGYGRDTQGFLKVKHELANSAHIFGDEPVMLAFKHKNVNFYVCEDRVEGVKEILKVEKPDWIFLDDAFQHLKIQRDVNIVVIDATEELSNYRFPPQGRLRNKPADILEAQIRILTKVNLVSSAKLKEVKEFFKCDDFIEMKSDILEVKNLKTGKLLTSGDVYLVSAIAKPANFKKNIEEKGFKVKGHAEFKDHHFFTANDISRIHQESKDLPIVVTEKDYSKLIQFDGFDCFVSRLEFNEITSIESLNVFFN